MTMSEDTSNDTNDLRAAHLASGRPRFSVSIRVGGVRTETWTDDRDAALTEHSAAAARPEVESVLTFDNEAVDMIAAHFWSDGRTYEEIAADCDAAIDAWISRGLAEHAGLAE